MQTRKIILFLFLSILYLSCDDDKPVTPTNHPPTIINLSVPDTVLTNIIESTIITAEVEDKDGFDNIDTVKYKIYTDQEELVADGIFYDDGNYENHGDNIAKDGKYSSRLLLTVEEGAYLLDAIALDKTNLQSETDRKLFYAKQGIANSAPTVTPLSIPQSAIVDTLIPFVLKVRVEDEDEGDFISAVNFQIFGPTIAELAIDGLLFDDGTSGDSLAEDGIYSIKITTEFAAWKFGSYYIFIQAFDSRQEASESFFTIIPWEKMNPGIAPVVTNLSAPDTVQIPETGASTFLLEIEATDLDHNNDIHKVFFNTYKPDGSLSDSSPLQMYDDGSSGDLIASDNIFTLRVYITSENSAGDYRFEFQAQDYSDLLSNEIIHIMTVIR